MEQLPRRSARLIKLKQEKLNKQIKDDLEKEQKILELKRRQQLAGQQLLSYWILFYSICQCVCACLCKIYVAICVVVAAQQLRCSYHGFLLLLLARYLISRRRQRGNRQRFYLLCCYCKP